MADDWFTTFLAESRKELGDRLDRLLPLNFGNGTFAEQLVLAIIKAHPSKLSSSDTERREKAMQALFGERSRRLRSDAIDDQKPLARMAELFVQDCRQANLAPLRSVNDLAELAATEFASSDEEVEQLIRRLKTKFKTGNVVVTPLGGDSEDMVSYMVNELHDLGLSKISELLGLFGIRTDRK